MSLTRGRTINVWLNVAESCRAAMSADLNVTCVDLGRMARSFEMTIHPAERPVSDLTLPAVITVRNLAIPNPSVNSVRGLAKSAALIPGVPNLARNLVHLARRNVRGDALIPGNAIYPALYLAASCHALGVASQSWLVDISVRRFAARRAHPPITVRHAAPRAQKV